MYIKINNDYLKCRFIKNIVTNNATLLFIYSPQIKKKIKLTRKMFLMNEANNLFSDINELADIFNYNTINSANLEYLLLLFLYI